MPALGEPQAVGAAPTLLLLRPDSARGMTLCHLEAGAIEPLKAARSSRRVVPRVPQRANLCRCNTWPLPQPTLEGGAIGFRHTAPARGDEAAVHPTSEAQGARHDDFIEQRINESILQFKVGRSLPLDVVLEPEELELADAQFLAQSPRLIPLWRWQHEFRH